MAMGESQRWACSIRNVVILILVGLFVSIALVAYHSPGLHPSVLLNNHLATARHSSKFCGPTKEAARGARGKQDIVQPVYFDLHLQALQKQDCTLIIRENVLWICVKEFYLEMLKKVWLDTKSLQEYSFSLANSNPHGVLKSSYVEGSIYAIIRDDENSNYVDEKQAKLISPLCRSKVKLFEEGVWAEKMISPLFCSEVNLFEQGVWAEYGNLLDSPYGVLTLSYEAQLSGQTKILDGSITSAEMQFLEDRNTRTEVFDIMNVEAEHCNRNLDQMEVQINAEDAPVIRDNIHDHLQVTKKVPVEAQNDTHSFKDNIFKFLPNQESIVYRLDESEADYSVHDSFRVVLSSSGSEIGNELQSPNHMEVVMAAAEKSLGAFLSSTSNKSLENILINGVISAFVFAAAVVCAYLVNWYRKRATYASPKTSPESVQEAQTNMNDPTQYPDSLQISTPDETLYEQRGSFVPCVQLLNDYFPSEDADEEQLKVRPMRRSDRIRNKTKDADEEQLKVRPVRRSDRIRNKTKSPPRSPRRYPPHHGGAPPYIAAKQSTRAKLRKPKLNVL